MTKPPALQNSVKAGTPPTYGWIWRVLRQCITVLTACFIVYAGALQGTTASAGDRSAIRGEAGIKLSVRSPYFPEESLVDGASRVLRDHRGFLWITTRNGLLRYDGHEIKNYSDPDRPNALPILGLGAMLLTKNGELWTSSNALYRYDFPTESFEHLATPQGEHVWALEEDDKGNIWMAGENIPLTSFSPIERQFVEVPIDWSNYRDRAVRTEYIHGLFFDKRYRRLWLLSASGLGFYDLASKAYTSVELPVDMEEGRDVLRDLATLENGDVYVAASNGLFYVNGETLAFRHFKADIRDPYSILTNEIWSVEVTSKGEVWVGSDKRGISRYDAASDRFYHIYSDANDEKSTAIPQGAVHDIYEDDLGSLWLSIGGFGIRYLNSFFSKFILYQQDPFDDRSLGFNNVLDLHEDEEFGIWVATDGGGLDFLNPQTEEFSHFRHDPSDSSTLASDSVIALEQTNANGLWVGTWGGGLNYLDKSDGKFTRILRDKSAPNRQSLGNNNVFQIEAADDDSLFVSVWNLGVQQFFYKEQRFENFFHESLDKEGIRNITVNDMGCCYLDRLWMSGNSHLENIRLDTKQVEDISTEQFFSSRALLIDEARETVWYAAGDGLYAYKPSTKTFKRYGRKDGLDSPSLFSIVKDVNDDIWVGTGQGLSKFNPESEIFTNYNEDDGIVGSRFNRYSALSARNGDVYFGSNQGLIRFNPNDLPVNSQAPNIVITDVSINDERLFVSRDSFYKKHAHSIAKLNLPHDTRSINFSFAALNYISSNRNRYRYRLTGASDSWTAVPSGQTSVKLAGLAPGTYVFEVQGSNNQGVWSKESASLSLFLPAPWYQSWWALAIAMLVIALTIYWFLRMRFRKNRRRETMLKELVDQKTEQLTEANNFVVNLNAQLEERVKQRTNELSVEVEERRAAESKLFHMAFHDPLTDLPNRAWLIQKLQVLIDGVQNSQDSKRFILMYLDGDRFKKVNDTHGHLLGDSLLVAASERLNNLLGDGCHVVRLGGDEFTVLMESVEDIADAETLAQQIVFGFEAPFHVNQHLLFFKVSIGIVECTNYYRKPEQILRDADIAMYRAKELGKGTYQFFDSNMRHETFESIELENDLYFAIERRQMRLVYQPIIDIQTGKLTGFEALLRWEHPTRGNIPPDKFISIAEESGHIFAIGWWVIEEACRQLVEWITDLEPGTLPNMAINISPNQLDQLTFIQKIDEIFSRTQVPSDLVKLEITETTIMENTDIINALLDKLRSRGIELAIDDFGTGYSSLSYLDKLPVQVLKIDRQFVNAITETDDAEVRSSGLEIVGATISLAHNLNLKVVAEGIETLDQWRHLKELDCDYGQGYKIAKPLEKQDAGNFIVNYIDKSVFDEIG